MRVTASRAAGREGDSQRDITNKERERVIGEAVALKKKLETIKTQRQKDAKDLR